MYPIRRVIVLCTLGLLYSAGVAGIPGKSLIVRNVSIWEKSVVSQSCSKLNSGCYEVGPISLAPLFPEIYANWPLIG